MNRYDKNNLLIYSDFEIRTLREMDDDIDLIVPIGQRVLNLYIEGMPEYLSDRFQFTEVKNIMVRHSLDSNNTYSTIHLLRSIDMNSALVNFTIDYGEKAIRIKDNESLDSALRRFKRQCAKSGVLSEIRKREHYEKPSVRRKKKSEAARKRSYK